MEPLFFIVIALIIGTGTRHFLRNTPLPYTVVLMIFGLGLGLLARLNDGALPTADQGNVFELLWNAVVWSFITAFKWAGNIEPHVIMFVFLPVLIFEAAFTLDFHTFKKTLGNAALLAVPGIVLAVLLTATLVEAISMTGFGFQDWGWLLAFAFGAVVSATDPVAVVAILKELGASKKLATLIEGESLLNDGTAIVIFFILMGILPYGLQIYTNENSVFVEFLRVSVGGILLGVVIGGIILIWVGKVFNDALIEITLIVVAAYMTFFIAEYFFHVSGVLGLVALGLSMASAGRTKISADVQHFLHEFWELAAFIANTLIFLIVGIVVAKRVVFTVNDFVALLFLYVGLQIVRGIVFFMFYPLMRKVGYGLDKKNAVVAWYGGLRGAISLSLALLFVGEIEKIHPDSSLALIADQFLFYIAGIVVLTLFINATTIKYVINELGLTKIPIVKTIIFSNTFNALSNNTIKELEIIRKDRFMQSADWDAVKKYLPSWKFPRISDEETRKINPLFEARRRILEKEKCSYWNQYKEGLLGSLAFTELSGRVSDVIDKNGVDLLNDRPYLDIMLRTPKILHVLQNVPVLKILSKKILLNQLASSYDIARGFVVSQEDALKLAASMDFKCHSNEDCHQIKDLISNEINKNRIKGLHYIKDVHQVYPEITKSIETRQAARSVLNFEKSNIISLKEEGRLENDEAIKLLLDVEKRKKKLMGNFKIASLSHPSEILTNVSWLQGVPVEIINRVVEIAQEKKYSHGEYIINSRETVEADMEIITRGSVKVFVNDSLVDLLGAGTVIGEMALLTGARRTADVIADSAVTTLFLHSKTIRQLIEISPELEQNLWNTAGLRFAENILGQFLPFSEWSQFKLRKWLSDGSVRKTKGVETIMFHGSVGVLLLGRVVDKQTNQIHNPPYTIMSTTGSFSENARVYVSPQIAIK